MVSRAGLGPSRIIIFFFFKFFEKTFKKKHFFEKILPFVEKGSSVASRGTAKVLLKPSTDPKVDHANMLLWK